MTRTRAASAARVILIVSALILPTVSLVPLGGLYLWQHGLLIWWALASLVVVVTVALAQRWLLRPAPAHASTGASDQGTRASGDASPVSDGAAEGVAPAPSALSPAALSPAEAAAWKDVQRIASGIDLDKLGDFQDLFDLGHTTVNTVARRLHPEKADALWRFTLPEALAISEQVSRRLSQFVDRNIPFGDRLTVLQVIQIYRWRNAVGVAERAYDIWRLVRLANPATAVTYEARERLSRSLLQWGREHVVRSLAETYVEEVGRAAIDLYSGRLRVVAGKNIVATSGVGEPGGTAPVGETPNGAPAPAYESNLSRPRGWTGTGRQAAMAIGRLARSVMFRRARR